MVSASLGGAILGSGPSAPPLVYCPMNSRLPFWNQSEAPNSKDVSHIFESKLFPTHRRLPWSYTPGSVVRVCNSKYFVHRLRGRDCGLLQDSARGTPRICSHNRPVSSLFVLLRFWKHVSFCDLAVNEIPFSLQEHDGHRFVMLVNSFATQNLGHLWSLDVSFTSWNLPVQASRLVNILPLLHLEKISWTLNISWSCEFTWTKHLDNGFFPYLIV